MDLGLADATVVIAGGSKGMGLAAARCFAAEGARDASSALIACGGAMGGLLGPGAGLYHQLGRVLADAGIATLRVGYRRPNDLESCTLDLGAAAELAFRAGARRVVTMGHSFGGAVAVRAAVAMPDLVAGVVT